MFTQQFADLKRRDGPAVWFSSLSPSMKKRFGCPAGPNYGIFQINVNGRGQPVDLYGPALKPKDPVDLGIFTLPAPGRF